MCALQDALLKVAIGGKPVKVSFRRQNMSALPVEKVRLLTDTSALVEPARGQRPADEAPAGCCGKRERKARPGLASSESFVGDPKSNAKLQQRQTRTLKDNAAQNMPPGTSSLAVSGDWGDQHASENERNQMTSPAAR